MYPSRFCSRGSVCYVLLATVMSCTGPIPGFSIPNQRPSVEFTHAPLSADPDDPAFYAYRVYWSGHDPDGRVERFEYCIDPTDSDSAWSRSERSEELLFFRATDPEPGTSPVPRATGYHVLVLRAVDNEGAYSEPKRRAFYSYTVAPSVQIRTPPPSALLQASIIPSIFIHWEGQDSDGQLNDRPVYYRHKLFSLAGVANDFLLSDPDSLRRRDAPSGFSDWDSTGAESTFVRLTNLTPGNRYLFAVVAFDEAGAYSPLFSLYENMLQMFVTLAASIGPRIHVFNSIVDYTYPSGGYTVDPLRWIPVEAGVGEPLRFNWDAITSSGSTITGYRWAVDLSRLDDNTARVDEQRDYHRWSRGSPLNTSCALEGLQPGSHFLYIEATDNNGLASLGVVHLTLVAPTFERDLLIVDDTRLEPDKYSSGDCMEVYKTSWPSAAELDTFLFARGGFPWRCTKEPVSGVLSTPGVFTGYAFDTLGTRLGFERPSSGVRLAELSRYRHIVWMVDRLAATYPDVLGALPMAALRYISTPGRASSLGAYVAMGGRVWLLGGGAGTANVDEYNRAANDDTRGRVYSLALGELGSGRLMYEGAHWQSAFAASTGFITLARAPRAEEIADAPWSQPDRWTGETLRAPDYRRLPPELRYRDETSDPLPPTRQARQYSQFYRANIACEYLVEPNWIQEDPDRAGDQYGPASMLDTLIEARSLVLRTTPAPIMTWYHGENANRFVFSGFAPWEFRREDCIALTDFVLQDIWGLRRQEVPRGAASARLGPEGASGRTLRLAAPRSVGTRARVTPTTPRR